MKEKDNRNGKIAVIGELNVDGIAAGLAGPPRLGAEVIATEFRLTLGSASAIFACGAARLGHDVTFISKVGEDLFGEICLAALKQAGVSTRRVLRDPHAETGITLSLSTRKDRALVTYPGAIASFGYDQFNMSALRGHRHLHMTSYFLQETLRPSFPRILAEARAMGLTTSFDPNSDPSQQWGDDIRDVLAHADLFFLNQEEALQLTRARSTRGALKVLGGQVSCAVIKLGRRGAVAIRDGEVAAAPGFKVAAHDTTGAGDSFAAGFVSAYLRGHTLAECLRIGNGCGALSTLKAGGTAGQPDWAALKRFLRRHSH